MPSLKILITLFTLYLSWGSCYSAIKIAIQTIPPLFMVGSQFIIAGFILLLWCIYKKENTISWSNWKNYLLLGLLMIVMGTGGLVLAEQSVPSGLSAVLISTEAFWMVLFDWIIKKSRPKRRVIAGLCIGLIGIIYLVDPLNLTSSQPINITGSILLLVTALAWAAGSVASRHLVLPDSFLSTISIQMLCGGILLILMSALIGELNMLHWNTISFSSWMAWGYLTLFGTLIGYIAYTWLLKFTTISVASSYAYITPIVALSLGGLIADEKLTGPMILACFVILTGVSLMVNYGMEKKY